MSSFNETIEAKRFQGGVGAASTTAEVLDGVVNNRKAGKAVHIRNLDGSIAIYVGVAGLTATNGYQVPAGQEIVLEVCDPWNLYVLAASGTPAYSWCAY